MLSEVTPLAAFYKPHTMNTTNKTGLMRVGSLLLADALFFGLTDPMNVASPLLIVGFLLMLTTLYFVILALLKLAKLYGLHDVRLGRRFARGTTAISGGLMALQSIGQLSTRDLLILLPLAMVAYLYSAYKRPLTNTSR
jgi:hypothetical protein